MNAAKPALFIVALLCFLLGTFAPPTRINIVALGLAAWVASLLF